VRGRIANAVRDYLNGGDWRLVGEFTEVESGKRTNNRPELEKALVAAKKHKATLILAKLDRLARNVAFIAGLMERKVEFVCCDMPTATPFMLHVYAAVAEEERRMIAARTKAGLAAAKAKGVELGNAKLAAENRTAAIARAKEIKPVLRELRGMSARAAAAELNARAVPTPTGAPDRHSRSRARWTLASASRAVVRPSLPDVRFPPDSGQIPDGSARPLCADTVVKVQNCPMIIFPP
jgi:DNA invertase Pin-like site-specific DNA recombinase